MPNAALVDRTFGVVVTKANSYFRGNTSDGALMKTTVSGTYMSRKTCV